MKSEQATPAARRHRLSKILASQVIDSQQDLVKALKAEGISVTQTTASRDLEAIGAIRVRDGDGNFRYLPPDQLGLSRTPMGAVSAREGLVLDILSSGNLAVVKTPPGGAQLFAGQIDEAIKRGNLPRAIATIAGDDTVFVVSKSASGGKDLIGDIWKFSGSGTRKPIKSGTK
jgi:transcriptional regulator of arginine metabolism